LLTVSPYDVPNAPEFASSPATTPPARVYVRAPAAPNDALGSVTVVLGTVSRFEVTMKGATVPA
jgi:hypothetical protein